MKIVAIELGFGYVESTSLASVVFSSRMAFDSEKKAFASLAQELKALYLDQFDTTPKLRKCCKKQTTKYCPDCGTRISEEGFDEEAFSDWLRQFPTFDLDSWGYHEYLDDGTPLAWEPAAQGYAYLRSIEEKGFDVIGIDHAEEKLLKYLNVETDKYNPGSEDEVE